jgi:hypothetical protein
MSGSSPRGLESRIRRLEEHEADPTHQQRCDVLTTPHDRLWIGELPRELVDDDEGGALYVLPRKAESVEAWIASIPRIAEQSDAWRAAHMRRKETRDE